MESCCKHGVISTIRFLFLLFLWKKKKCIIFAVHPTFLNHRTELSSVSHVGADHHVESWGKSFAAFLGEWKAKLDVLIPTQPSKKLPRIQIWQQTECLHWGFVCSWSSLPLEVPMSSVGCLLPGVFLDIQMMWTAKEQVSPPSPAVLLLSLTDAQQAQPCAANSTGRTCYFTKLLRSKPWVILQMLTRKVLKFASFRWWLFHL